MAKMRQKSDLPSKICQTCKRPFAWRKKWAKDWDQVRYCSGRCRREKSNGSERSGATGWEGMARQRRNV